RDRPVRALDVAPARDEAGRRDPPARDRSRPDARARVHELAAPAPRAHRRQTPLRPLPDCVDGLMLDFRYHVTSLVAVFLALIVGIVVGVGISGSGFVV